MAATNLIGTTGFGGSLQKFLNKKFFNLERRFFDSPLANSILGVLGTIPNNQGQSVEFRKFDNLSPATSFDQKSEPAADSALQADTVEAALKELAQTVGLGNLLMKTDLTDLMAESFKLLMEALKRGIHRATNDALVNAINDINLFEGFGNFSSNPLKSIFAGDVSSYAALTDGSFFRMRDFINARSALENGGVPPGMPNGDYAVVLSHSVQAQLIEDDEDFRGVVAQADNQNDEIIRGARVARYSRMSFMLQHDEYRSNLPTVSSGELKTRVDGGAVQVAHVLGRGAFGYVDLAGDRAQRMSAQPRWKVQDISKTGNETTIGYRVPFRAAVIDDDNGVNVVGTSKFDKTVASL